LKPATTSTSAANGERNVPQTKTKTRTKATLLAEPTPALLAGPQTEDEWFRATMKAIREKNPSESTKQEYRKVLEQFPGVVSRYGDLSVLFRNQASQRFGNHPVMEEAVRVQLKTMRAQLAGDDATLTELLLIDAVLACYHDYWTFLMIYEQTTGGSFNMHSMTQWERVLASKEGRYMRAIETLARVRRLLKLPTMQVNIAAAGGQQVNVAGEVKP
jgi:hypothetical protein